MSNLIDEFRDTLLAEKVASKFSATQLEFQVFIDGKPFRKTFKATSMNAIWNQFNKWAKSQGAEDKVEGSSYLGGMAWKTDLGIAELKKI